MKRILKYLFSILLIFAATGSILGQDNWLAQASYGDYGYQGTYGCSIGNKGYVLTGTLNQFNPPPPTNELSEFDPATNTWTQKGPTPEPVKNYGLAFSIGNKGYFALSGGIWEYDPAIDAWTRKLNLPAGISTFSIGFEVNGKGYFGWGAGADLWEYNPVTDTWVQKADFPGNRSGSAFSIGDKGYVATNGGQNPDNIFDLWSYDPGTDIWTQKASFGGPRYQILLIDALGSNAFRIGNRGYIATALGSTPYSFSGRFYEYDPTADTWTQRTPLGGLLEQVGFGIGNKGYMGFGIGSYRTGATPYRGFAQYTPAADTLPVILTGTGTGLQGSYYKGIHLSGTPLLTRIDTAVNFELTYSKQPQVLSPAPGIVPEDMYSVRWTGQVQPQYSETYTFYTVSDDGVRLWVNGVQLVDNWTNQSAAEKSGSLTLVAGQKYDITIEYYENTGDAVTQLLWSSASTPKAVVPKTQLYPTAAAPATGTGLLGFYYKGINLTGAPVLNRVDTTIDFELTYGKQPQVLSPAPGIVPEDMYSVRWLGQVQPQYSENYTFYTVGDDGIRLWVNGIKLIDNWTNQAATEKSGTIALTAGEKYDIVMEYYENTGDAVTQLLWSGASTPKAIIPASRLYPVTNGLQGVYYSGIELSGNPLLSRIDTSINFELTYGKQPQVLSPAPGFVPADKYSVRWTGQVKAQFSETYTFYTVADDGIRLWVNGVQLVNNWSNQSATENSGSIALLAGQQYDITIEYYENTGDAVTKLYWSSASTPKSIVPKAQLFPPALITGARTAAAQSSSLSVVPESIPLIPPGLSPNPVQAGQTAKLVIYSDKPAAAMLTVWGSRGEVVRIQTVNLVTGLNHISINTHGIGRGVYIIGLAAKGRLINSKLVVQ